jgi:hypothetical protein
MPEPDALDSLLNNVVGSGGQDTTPSKWAQRHFLNPDIPYAQQDDPDGSYHAQKMIRKPDGSPLKGLKEDEKIQLMLRPYQQAAMNAPDKWRTLRWARRAGKSYQIGIEVFNEALRNPNAQVLVLAPSQNQVKVIFDDYLRPLLRTYDHRISGKVGIEDEPAEVGSTADFAVVKDTQKPQEIVIAGEDDHRATIRGMVISDSARGQSASFLVVDEADYADSEDMEQIVGPIMMTDPSTRMLMVSTPSGKGDTFFRSACNSNRWWSDHKDFTVLPHYDQDLHNQMAEMAGGEDTNTFKREYLAQWGSTTEGVFDQESLEKSYIISPYPLVMEEIDRRKGNRNPMLAADRTQHAKNELAAYNGVRPLDYNVNGDSSGARSVYRSKHRGKGIITAGTDWNDLAGMQTVLVWWPPQDMLNNGSIEVSRFPHKDGAPVTTQRAKNEEGKPRTFKAGQENGIDYHDLSPTRGIVIWHGRLESGRFTWASAANRVCSIMGVDDFINAWYVDRGYGVQVNQMIKQIMESGEYIPDQRLLTQSRSVDEGVLRNMNRFHPDRDSEVTGRIYRTIRFGENYDHREIDHAKGQGNYKNVMINLLQRMVEQHRLLFPYGALTGKLSRDEMGEHKQTEYNLETREEETVRTPVTEDDRIDENGASPSRGDDAFGGLLTQMQTTKVDGYTPQGKPRYKGDWHAVDALMLATLAYWENYTDEFGGNMFNPEANAEGRTEEDIFSAAADATESARRDNERFGPDSIKQNGPFRNPSYNDAREPLEALADGRKTSEEVGTSMDEMVQSAQQWWKGRG